MYFSNISDKELQYFKGLKIPNFSISLTEMLTSKLFKIETIIAGNLYKIYPLFYTNKIISSNPDDNILDNKCLIVSKQTKETYFQFIKDEDKDVVIYHEDMSFHNLSDELSVDQYNSLVAMLRSQNSFVDNIEIRNSHINGEYGEYIFDLKSTTIVDTGVLITKETLDKLGTVRLVNPVFEHSQYILSLKVYSVSDYNLDLSDKSNIIVTQLEVILEKDTNVNIPFETLEMNNIVGFDAEVTVNHNYNVVKSPADLTLNISGINGFVDDNLTLTAVLVDNEGAPVSEADVSFFNEIDGIPDEIGIVETDENGIATITDYTPSTDGVYDIYCILGEDEDTTLAVSNHIIQRFKKHTLNLTARYVPANNLVYLQNSYYIVWWVEIDGGLLIPYQDIKLFDNDEFVKNIELFNSGTPNHHLQVWTNTLKDTVNSNHNYQIKFDETDNIYGAESSIIPITCRKVNVKLTENLPDSLYYNKSTNYVLKLEDEFGNPIKNTNITLNGDTVTLNDNGVYENTLKLTGDLNFTVSYDGTDRIDSLNYSKLIKMDKAPVYVHLYCNDEISNGSTIIVKVGCAYPDGSEDKTFNPESIIIRLNNNPITVTNKTDRVTFKHIVNGIRSNKKNATISAEYTGTDYYAGEVASKRVDMYKIRKLTATKSGKSLIIKGYDANDEIVNNFTLDKVVLGASEVTNIQVNSGQATINNISAGTGACYAIFEDITSNRITF